MDDKVKTFLKITLTNIYLPMQLHHLFPAFPSLFLSYLQDLISCVKFDYRIEILKSYFTEQLYYKWTWKVNNI